VAVTGSAGGSGGPGWPVANDDDLVVGEVVEIGPRASEASAPLGAGPARAPLPPRPACPPLRRFGEPGESLDAFRARLLPELQTRIAERLARLEAVQAPERTHWDRRLAELKELLACDRRELVALRTASSDAAEIRRAEDRARLRIEKYKQAQSLRADLVKAADNERFEAELWSLEMLAACTLLPT
jgi:hypothetical protein